MNGRDRLLAKAVAVSKRKLKLWVWILLSILGLLLLGVGWFGYSMYRYGTVTVPNAYAQWAAAELVCFHMHTNNGAWPKSWEDLQVAWERHEGRFHCESVDQVKKLIDIDWEADPAILAQAQDGRENPPFRVIRRRDGGKSHWQGAEPNQLVLDYLKGKWWFLPEE